jgi:5-hydroxyisourate hydrolase-like protein (transthyretin family)
MKLESKFSLFAKTTRCRWSAAFGLMVVCALFFAACSSAPKAEEEHEEEALARTEFTKRIENFFEYAPLRAGKPSQFLIHLTDLTDGTPVEKADVTLKIKRKGMNDFNEVKAKVGRVTGIYVADVEIGEKGTYDIEFHVKNEKLDEKMPLENFEVE